MPRILARLELMARRDDDQGTISFRFRPDKPLKFTAGQHGLWYIPRGGIKPFSIASAPEDEEVVLGTTLTSGSRVKRALALLTPGSPVYLTGPLSTFVVDPAATELVLLAQGIAVTPFRSILRHQALQTRKPETSLIHVGRTHPFRSDTEPLTTLGFYPNSRAAFTAAAREAAHAQPNASFMVAGTPAFVADVKAILATERVPLTHVKSDAFAGWSGPRAGRSAPPGTASDA